MEEEKKKRGRPPLSPEEKEKRRIVRNKSAADRHKKNGYVAQKKYRNSHPEKYNQNYEPKIRIPLEKKDVLTKLIGQTGLTITQLFVGAVEEKYGVNLSGND